MSDDKDCGDRIQVEPGTVDPEQISLILAAIETVQSSPGGCGEVRISIDKGRVRFVEPAPRLDAFLPHRERRWLRWEERAKGKRK